MNLPKYLVEFIGTFFLVLTIGMTVLAPGDAGPLAPLAIGMVLAVMIFAGGHISGGHFNPAVTLAVFLRGKCPPSDVVPYMLAQIAAAGAAAALVPVLKDIAPHTPIAPAVVPSLIGEFLFTFALCWVVLQVATTKAAQGNSYFGLAIGMTVLAGAFAVGPISGGAFNPAVAIGLVILGIVKGADVWIHLVGALAGGAAAAGAFKVVVRGE